MLGNIVDHRTDCTCPDCDVVFEPSSHDGAKRADGSEFFSYELAASDASYFYAEQIIDTTVRDAVLRAETQWSFAVTAFLYDLGRRPLGPE